MTIADNVVQRRAWLSRCQRVKLELEDLRIEIDVAMRQQRQPFSVIKALARADVHLENAIRELADAGQNVGAIQ